MVTAILPVTLKEREAERIMMINIRKFYNEEDIYRTLVALYHLDNEDREVLRNHVIYGGYGADNPNTYTLLNIISNPMEYDIKMEPEVTEELIRIADWFGLI